MESRNDDQRTSWYRQERYKWTEYLKVYLELLPKFMTQPEAYEEVTSGIQASE